MKHCAVCLLGCIAHKAEHADELLQIFSESVSAWLDLRLNLQQICEPIEQCNFDMVAV